MKKLLLTAAFALCTAGGAVFSQSENTEEVVYGLFNGLYDYKSGSFGIQFGGVASGSINSFSDFAIASLFDYTRYKYNGAAYNELSWDLFFGIKFFGLVCPFAGGGIGIGWNDGGIGWDDGKNEEIVFAWKVGAGTALTLGPVVLSAVYSYNGHTDPTLFLGAGFRLNMTEATPTPTPHPTITPEELHRVELAYADTVQAIGRRGKRLYINNMSERSAFIQRWQGRPNTAEVNEARNTKLPYYSIYETSQEKIVALAKKEPNQFLKVRMIHDWVADIFSYDYDLLWWMDNVSGRNEEFTLRAIVSRQRGVCFEYAILFWFLLDAAGLDVYLISDHSAPNIGHAYNMVVIDGTGYIIDTSWDSGNQYVNGRITRFKRTESKDYFMPSVSQSYRLRRW